jgi:Tripartite tricarboxylate transporter family receptor
MIEKLTRQHPRLVFHVATGAAATLLRKLAERNVELVITRATEAVAEEQTYTINATLYDKLNFDFIRDIAPISRIATFSFVMEVNPSVPTKTLPEFIAYAKANPGKIIRGIDQEKRIAVRRRTHDRFGGDVSARAWPVLDDELLTETLR